ncbi:MAG: LysM peptidoglycan-binding domain-containing protein [Sulfitobacter sp.]|uniref:LysM peptidoglycan-binding domain-containing protein n=1 Tax=Sulfitobacter sp. TaxID=1903071 RepID=UPI0032988C6B
MFKGFGRFGGMGAMAAGAFAAAVLALGAWIGSKRSGPEEAGQTTVAVLPERDATPENATLVPNAVQGVSVGPEDAAATEPKVTQQATEPQVSEPQAPAFDEVRRESDGMTVIAGRAAPGSSVAVLKDGKEIATATADGSGKFATLAMIPPDGKGHVLTLLGQDGETKLASEEEIILTPNAAPLQMAEADTTLEQSPLGIAEEGADPGGEAAADEGAEPDPASPGDAQVESEASDVTSLAEAEMTRETPADQTASTDAPAEERDEAAIEPAATAPEQATPLAGTATAEAAESQPTSDDGSPAPAAASETATAEQETIEGGGQSEPTETGGAQGSASEQEPAAGEGAIANISDPTQATPLSGTGTAEGVNAAPEQEAATGEGETATVSDPTQATPLSETGTAEGAGSAPEQDQATEAGEDLATGTAPSQATPLAGTGTGAGLAGTGTSAGDNTAPDQGQQTTSDTPAQATPLAETGTADPATGAADGTASPAQGATTPNPTTDAPSLAERDAPSPETTNPTPTKETDTTAAPAQPSAPAPVLKSTAEGVERLDTAPPQVMTNVALDTIGYSDQGDVQLAGRAQPDTSEVRVYLNNNAVISLPVDQEGRWRGDLPNVDEGVYTLRVDELSRAGDVTSRVETPFKRESPEVLAAATEGLSGPLSAVTVQKGDTLWAISRERYGDPLLYVKVFEANSGNIRDPDLIYPGQVFDLPEEPASE